MIIIDIIGHMVSTKSENELHVFARKLGLKRKWYQDKNRPHYDLTTDRMRRKAIGIGAKSVSSYQLITYAWWQEGR